MWGTSQNLISSRILRLVLKCPKPSEWLSNLHFNLVLILSDSLVFVTFLSRFCTNIISTKTFPQWEAGYCIPSSNRLSKSKMGYRSNSVTTYLSVYILVLSAALLSAELVSVESNMRSKIALHGRELPLFR